MPDRRLSDRRGPQKSRPRDLAGVCREAEILVVAIGKTKFVTAEMVLAGKIRDGETIKITAGKDGLKFNGAAAK